MTSVPTTSRRGPARVSDDLVPDARRNDETRPEHQTEKTNGSRAGGHIPYWPALDGLRGIALVVVLAYHAGINHTDGAFFGLSTFFTLSGFLITSLLLSERESTNRIGLKAFWVRRFRRLMPAAMLTLAGIVVFGATVASAEQLRMLRGDVLGALGYMANWRFILSGQSYGDIFGDPSPVQHFWSLAVEEQFYLIFPLLCLGVLAVARGSRKILGTTFAVLAAASTTLMLLLFHAGADHTRQYYGTDTRATEILLGALLAVIVTGRTNIRSAVWRLVSYLVGAMALLIMILLWTRVSISSDWVYRGGLTVYPLATIAVMIAAMQSGGPVRHFLGLRPFRWLGRVSYGAYLFHWPLYLWLTEARTGLSNGWLFLLRFGLTLLLAGLSSKYVEIPIRTGKRLLGSRAFLAAPAVASAVAVALVLVTTNPPQPLIVFERQPDQVALSRPKVAPGAPAPPPAMRMMWVGDSMGMTMSLGIRQWGTQTGKLWMKDTTEVGCGIGKGGRIHALGYERSTLPACDNRFSHWLTQVGEFKPDVVAIVTGLWDIADHQIPGTRRWVRVGDAAYDDWIKGQLSEAISLLGSQGALVVVLSYPRVDPHYVPKLFMGKPPYDEAQPWRVVRWNEILREVVAQHPDARLLDFAGYLSRLPGGDLEPSRRPDGVHFTTETTTAVGEWVGPQLYSLWEHRDDTTSADVISGISHPQPRVK